MNKKVFTILLATSCNSNLQCFGVIYDEITIDKNPKAKVYLDKFYKESNNQFATYKLEDGLIEEKSTRWLLLSENSAVSKVIDVEKGFPGYIDCFVSKIGNKITDILFEESFTFTLH